MLEWFLSYEDKDNFIAVISLAIFTGLLLWAFWIKINENKHKVMSKTIGSLALILPISIILITGIININTKETYISNSDWKVVYEKDDEINIEILFDGDFFYNNFKSLITLKATFTCSSGITIVNSLVVEITSFKVTPSHAKR